MDTEIGSVESGKYVDIVAVHGDPTADVKLMEQVDFVLKDGTVYKSAQ